MPRRLLAVWNALTAAALLFLAAKLLRAGEPSPVILALVGALGMVSALGTAASLGMWRGTRWGAILTLILQGSHLLQMETSPLTYLTSLPVALVLGLGVDGHLHGVADWRPALEVTPDSDRPEPWIGIDLLAMAALVVAARALRSRRDPGRPIP
jgi:hypothetical protein